MLTGRLAPCLPPWPIIKLKLQGRYAGFKTDDFIVFTKDPQSQKEAKLLAQIKHDIGITEGNETFAEVIQAAWNDFNDASVFDQTTDALVLITGPLSATDVNNVRPLLEWARHSEDETEFLSKVNTALFGSDTKRAKLQAFRAQLTKANGGVDVSDKQLWEFLKSFYLLGYDLDTDSGTTLSLIQSLIAQYTTENPLSLWARVLDAVQSVNQNAGTITLETLPQDIVRSFKTKTGLTWDLDLKKLKEHGEYIIGGIRTTIGGVHIKRSRILTQLLEVSESSKFVFISGERGCGKSSLVREFFQDVADRAPVFCLRTEDLDKAHLDNVFSSIGLLGSLGDVEAGFALMPRKYLLIESIEKLLELENSAAFTDLLQFLNKHPGWTVIATGRDYAFQQIVFNFFQPSGLIYSSVIVDNFDDDEVRILCEELEPLRAIASNPLLNPLLKNPFFAELAYRVTEAGTQFSGSDGEKEFRIAVWRDVIAKEHARAGGMPLKRKETFIDIAVSRAKELVYGVPEGSFDPETLLRLEEDNLIRRDAANELVSPAHDVLEDWALERFIEDKYRQYSGNVAKFLEAVGDEPAMNRAFRLWLHQKLKDGDNVNDLVLAILNSREIQRYWQDETISAVLLGPKSYEFLNQLKDQLFENGGELLKRFCFILRISCKTPDQELIKLLSTNKAPGPLDTLYLKPFGLGWESVIRFLFDNKESVSSSLVPHVTAVIDEWGSLINIERDLPEPARQAGLLALWLLDMLKDSYRDEGIRKKVISVIIKTIPTITDEFNQLLDSDVFSSNSVRRRPSYVEDLCNAALENIETAYLCKNVPDTVIKLALHEWLIKETQEDDEEILRGSRHMDVADYFGLHPYRNKFFPPSGSKGLFQPLLRYHPRKGLDFILQLLNSTAEKYAYSELDSPNRFSRSQITDKSISAEQIEIKLDDGTSVKQFCSGRLWLAYRGESVVPYLLQSALMALENWLINFAEYHKSQENLEWIFDHILRNSNSVMPTAVLASVATGFPNRFGKAALPLLRTPELYNLDMGRIVHERGGNEMNWFASSFQRDPFADLYADERRTAALRPWRQEHLESLIIRLQFSGLKQEAFAVIDELRSKAPEGEIWRFRFHRIDSRGWKPVEDRENNRIIFEPQGLEPDLEEIQKQNQEQMNSTGRFLKLKLWSEKVFNRETTNKDSYSNWDEALSEAKELLGFLKEGSVSELARMSYGGIVKAAAIFLRDHSKEMKESDVEWCAEGIIQAVLADANSDNSLAMADVTDFGGAAAASSVLPVLLDFTEEGDEKLFIKTLIATALTHANATVQEGAANGIREHLWERDTEYAQKCIFGIIEYARLEVENRFLERQRILSLDDSKQADETKQKSWLEDLREQMASGSLSVGEDCIDKLDFKSYSPWRLINSCLMIPNGSTDSTHIALFSRVLTLFFNAEESTRKHRSDRMEDDISIHYELRLKFSKRFGEYLFRLYESDSQLFIDQLLKGCDNAPEFIEYLLLTILLQAERADRQELYWNLWMKLSIKVQTIALENAQNDPQYGVQEGSRKLIRGMLKADTPWQKIDYENQDIALGKEPIFDFVKNAGKNPDAFEAMASLMYHFPKIFFEPGIHILAKQQAESGGTRLLSGRNTAFYLEASIRRYLQIEETGPLSKEMHQSCFILLNAIVETASSRAYYLREQLIRSRRIA
jgi:hypothetical protein